MPSFATMPSLSLPQWLAIPLFGAINRLEFTLDPRISLKRLSKHSFTWRNEGQYLVLAFLALSNLSYIASPGWIGKTLIVLAYILGLLIPLTSQFILPATPIFSWLVLYWSSRYTPEFIRPNHIWVSVLPTLESVLYGANISDILTRITNPFLDVLAWLPYGILHFGFPFVTAALIWIFGPPGAVKFFAKVFGYINIIGVAIQIFFPSTPPWYELRNGMTPADFSMKGSPGGLGRIDALFGGNGYTVTFTNSPMPFGAFPSLHAGCSTTDALLLNHFFPRFKILYVIYVLWLYWATMYLTHHYLIDVVAGAALAVFTFYFFLDWDPIMRDWQFHFGVNGGVNTKLVSSASSSNNRNNLNGYASGGGVGSGSIDDEAGHLMLNGHANIDRDLEGGSSSIGIGMQDLSREAQSAQEYELPLGGSINGSGASRRGSLPNSPLNAPTSLTSTSSGMNNSNLNPNNIGSGLNGGDNSTAGTSSSHSPRMAVAAASASATPRVGSPAIGHANPFLSAPHLNRSGSKDGSAKAGSDAAR